MKDYTALLEEVEAFLGNIVCLSENGETSYPKYSHEALKRLRDAVSITEPLDVLREFRNRDC